MKSHGDIAIKVETLSKCYHIYDNPRNWLKQIVLYTRLVAFKFQGELNK